MGEHKFCSGDEFVDQSSSSSTFMQVYRSNKLRDSKIIRYRIGYHNSSRTLYISIPANSWEKICPKHDKNESTITELNKMKRAKKSVLKLFIHCLSKILFVQLTLNSHLKFCLKFRLKSKVLFNSKVLSEYPKIVKNWVFCLKLITFLFLLS